MTRILVLDEIHEDGLALLYDRAGLDLTQLKHPSADAVAAEMARTECLLLRGRTLDPAVWDAAPDLRMVSRHGVGCDNLPLDRLQAAGITVAITASANAVSVAEHAMMLMLASARGLVASDAAVRAGDFKRRERTGSVELSGRTLLIVGLGRIGRELAGRAAAFGMHVTGFDPALPEIAAVPGVERMPDLDEALAEADVVSLHLPRTSETTGLFNAVRLGRMKHGAILVNTARGGIVDETALADALRNGTVGAAGFDVFMQEPLPKDDPLLDAPNLIVTPHDAAMTREGAQRMSVGAARNLLDFLDGRLDLMNQVLPR